MDNLYKIPEVQQNVMRLKLFCDESGSPQVGWLYFAILFVPESIESFLLQDLLNKRCDNETRIGKWGECNPKCKFHERNNVEIHFIKVNSNRGRNKYNVACRWIDYFLQEVDKIFLYILGINLNKLDRSYFGDDSIKDTIYNRFFRTAILKASKSFFSKYEYNEIIITEIIHDESSSKESHYYFNWHPIFFINLNDPRVKVVAPEIRFLDSDHRKPRGHRIYSHFLQFADLVLGCTRNCLDYTSSDELKRELSLKALELIERLINAPGNVNSSYKYVNRIKIDFFPKHDIRQFNNYDLQQLKRWDSFYTKRELAIQHRDQGILSFRQ